MSYSLTLKPTFLDHLLRLPRSVQKRAGRVIKRLEEDPSNSSSKNIEKLKHAERLWTCRVTDNHRLLYAIHPPPSRLIQLLDVGTHDDIYRTARETKFFEQELGVGVLEDVLDPTTETTMAQIETLSNYWQYTASDQAVSLSEENGNKEMLPMVITAEMLQDLGIPAAYHDRLVSCETEDDLLDAEIPVEVFDRVYNRLYAPALMDIAQEPNYVLNDPDDLLRYADGDLLGFLLLLDPEQEKLVQYSLRGPTLVKGGPGSGKSTVALYRVKALVERAQLHLEGMRPRILFTTYTNALIHVSRQLLTQLLGSLDRVEVNTLDKIAYRIVQEVEGAKPRMARFSDWEAALDYARSAFIDEEDLEWQLLNRIGRFSDEYLIDEMQLVIEGQRVETLKEYFTVQRFGRTHPLSSATRLALWHIYEQVQRYFHANHLLSWGALRRRAIHYIRQGAWTNKYDYVIVDEAQDLTPTGLELCVHLCESPAGLFLTADVSQSIYNRGFSWQRVHESLRVKGRTRILKKNYRTTRQIAEAAHTFLRGAQVGDREVFAQQYVYAGPLPRVFGANGEMQGFQWLYQELLQAKRQVRQDWGGIAILVPKNRLADSVLAFLAQRDVPAVRVRKQSLDLSDGKVKVMTIHAAKGLEFPIVALPYLNAGELPRELSSQDRGFQENLEEQRRLFYVACTRAMRRLFLVYDQNNPSPFIKELRQWPHLWDFADPV